MAVDAADRVPAGHLDLLAAEGLYGLAGPPERGGLGADPATASRVIETLAGGCLATAFVWLQHHGVVRAVAADRAGGPGATWLEPLCRGERRAGVALGGTLPGAPLRARPVRGGYLLEGLSPNSAADPARVGLGSDAMPAARANAAEFAARAAAALVAAAGSRGILAGEHPQRLARESLFLLVFGSRPTIKERLVSRLTATAR
jgi:alkylation response protein AidB-like acyl-CoA dehydrogenase